MTQLIWRNCLSNYQPLMKNVWKFVAKCLGVNNLNIHDLNGRDLSYGTTNLFVSIGDKSVYFRNFAEKGILRVGDLISNKNELIIKSELRVLNLSPLDAFRLVSLIDALPTQWRESLKTCISTGDTPFNLRDEIKLSLSGQIVLQSVFQNFLQRTSKQNRHSTNC